MSANNVTIADAMLFDAPDREAWRVLVGVVDALELQLDPEAFAQAVKALADYADQRLSDDVRSCPRSWLNIFFDESPDPRLALVRSLDLDWSFLGWNPKNFAAWVELLATAPHIDTLSTINLYSMQTGKGPIKALTQLFRAATPSRWRLMHSKSKFERELLASLDEAGLHPERVTSRVEHNEPPLSTDSGALAASAVNLELEDTATFGELMARDDLNHVVSLSIEIRGEWNSSSIAALTEIAAPAWTKLRYLSVRIQGEHDAIARPLTTWLARARPICVEAEGRAVSAALLQHGVYQRALGSVLFVHNLEDLREPMRAGQVHVMSLVREANSGFSEGEDVLSLIQDMPAKARAALRVLDWQLRAPEFPQIEEIASSLPKLTIWCVMDAAVTDERSALIEQFAASPSTRKIRLLIPHEPYRPNDAKTPTFAAKHAKQLERGVGLRAGAYAIYKHSAYPFMITW